MGGRRCPQYSKHVKGGLLKGTGHYWYLLKIYVTIETLLGNEQWRAVDSIEHCEKHIFFVLKPFIIHLKAHKVMQQRCFSFTIFLQIQ